jgi:hypothetical protein
MQVITRARTYADAPYASALLQAPYSLQVIPLQAAYEKSNEKPLYRNPPKNG